MIMGSGNAATAGVVRDEHDAPFPGLVVEVRDDSREVTLGSAVTDADGAYRVEYDASQWRSLLHRSPDLTVAVLDHAGVRELWVTPPFDKVGDDLFVAPPIVVPRLAAVGWKVTAGGREHVRVARGSEVSMLVDGAVALDAIVDSISRARHRVCLLQLLLEEDFIATFEPTVDPRLGATPRRRLLDALRDAARRGVEVRILLNENRLAPDHADEVRGYFEEHDAERVAVTGFTCEVGVMHAKTLVVDAREAFVIGPPFEQRFWCTRAHHAEDARRGESQPVHDTVARVRGPGVGLIVDHFRDLWDTRRIATPELARMPDAPDDAARGVVQGGLTVQLARTSPRDVFVGRPLGETSILEAYGRALAHAERFVYFENQYLTSGTFTRLLGRFLDRKPHVQVILVVNEKMDVPTYDTWMAKRFRELKVDERENVGVFTLWSPGVKDGHAAYRPIYVHSKASVVDDAWATLGTANLDGVSLDDGLEFNLEGRSEEVNVLLFDGVDDEPATGVAREVRADLWSEHLGVPRDELVDEPPGGWLALWRRVANENRERAIRGEPLQGFALPFHPELPKERKIPI